MKSLFQYRFAFFYAMGLTVIFYLIIPVLRNSDSPAVRYMYDLFASRGPVPAFIVLIFFYVLMMVITARRREDYKNSLIIGLYAYTVFPIILGFMATVLGSASALGRYNQELLAAATDEDRAEALWHLIGGIGVATDTTLLGLLSACALIPVIFSLCVSRKEEEAESVSDSC